MPQRVQSVLIPKDSFTLKQAREWVKTHGYTGLGVDVTEDHYRFRQMTPRKDGRYRTIELPNKVKLVLLYYNSGM